MPIFARGRKMFEIVEYGNINLWENLIVIPPKCNKIWGSEYSLMDSKNLEYEPIIDMFVKIRGIDK
jgi:hypothetical protein